ncbi:MAG: putative TIM-barrel fold metal-dependent hydrolase [Gammaproteobacteria bacterium]|jgi:predicted TIM-barrel fold metal-dependent hydrolase
MSADTPRTKSGHFLIREDWLGRCKEDVIDPELPIIDPHHHLWYREGHQYYLNELLEDTSSGHNIVATVFVECHAMYREGGPQTMQPVGEVEFANGIAAMSASGAFGNTRAAAGIVSYADLGLGTAVEEVLAAQIVVAGGRLRGVRNSSVWHPDPAARGSSLNAPEDVLRRPAFREGLKRLSEMGLSWDAWMYHTQLDELVDIARAMPAVNIIMNHVGGPIGIGPYAGKRDEVFTHWRDGINKVASCPNVSVKLGGLGMRLFGFDVHAGAEPPSSEQLAAAWGPYIETCIEAFGAERAMFESNFPVDKGSCSYNALWNAFKRIAADASEDEKDKLFRATAARVYRLEVE